MKINSIFCGCTLGYLLLSCTPPPTDYASYVNPFIGTGGHGHTYPGAIVPHGMIHPSPDTRIHGWDACSGYYYEDTSINGFSHTHLSGTGCGDYGDILIMPTVGVQQWYPLSPESQQTPYASAFSHDREIAQPGYYAVFLERYGVKAELTATERGAIHRYTFPASEEAGFIVDLDYSLQGQRNEQMKLEVISNTEIRGSKKTAFWAFDQYIYFYIKFSRPFSHTLITDSVVPPAGENTPIPQAKVLLHFRTAPDEEVLVKVGVSAVDTEGARRNAESEITDWEFDSVRRQAREKWNNYLSKIDIETGDEDKKTIFYTALYHTAFHPNLFTDADGRYRGMDLQIHQGTTEDPVYTVFSLWDTFRAYHPLMTVIDPEKNEAFIRSLIRKHQEGGILPMWELAGNYTGTMIGYHAVPVIADAYMKGYRDFDIQEAYQACLKTAGYDTTGIICPPAVLPHLVPAAKYWKDQIGYVPCDKDNEAVAKGLEYAYNDWCISLLAGELGDRENEMKYKELAESYRFYFDPETRFMRGLDSEGNWRTPFHPRSSTHRNDDYCEGTAWQWTWFAPHRIEGLVELMGGRKAFIEKLDSLFIADSALEGELVSADISGLIGQYAHGNEPSHHIIHLYNYVDQPYKTQELADSVLHTLYFNDPDGLSGNEDCGQMSAWYLLNAMGFYQVCPGEPIYSIGRPVVDRATIRLSHGKTFRVIVRNNSRHNKYVRSVRLNGIPLEKPFFHHRDITEGGTLEFIMTDKRPE